MGRRWSKCNEKRSSLWRGIGIGAGIGGALMFLLDPDRGRRRRAMARDKAIHGARRAERVLGARSRDWINRTRGAAAQVRTLLSRERVPDDVLTERVRAEMGHAIANPGSIDVRARQGVVTLSGPILTGEEGALVSRVASVRGVARVENQLEIHELPDVSGLQGSSAPRVS